MSLIAAPFPRQEIPAPGDSRSGRLLRRWVQLLPNRGTALLSDDIDRAVRDRTFAVRDRIFARNASCPLLLAPSGSGSLEPRDLVEPGGGARSTMHDAVRARMKRELCEETGPSPDSVAETELAGFARWTEHAAPSRSSSA
ncbi:hypothetical protein [Saccharopolyspora spinosa]|uniref:NUDIX domain-containing protein n=1 Tax=Saccharopolyspora spinosa TaxID=60894 RepID=A0A2N3XR04_SACSN|nr:hypothetical protein [Saccharopolyspora spinosa]PKW13114.1 hypothetical protein A8926_0620 [Saccharopolyspora spinosa]